MSKHFAIPLGMFKGISFLIIQATQWGTGGGNEGAEGKQDMCTCV